MASTVLPAHDPRGNHTPLLQRPEFVESLSSLTVPDDLQDNEVFTSGEIARLLRVAPRTACKLIDNGHIRGWKIPGSRDRRASRGAVVKFIRENAIDINLQPRKGVKPR